MLRVRRCLTEFGGSSRVPGRCPNILQEAQAGLVGVQIVYPSPDTLQVCVHVRVVIDCVHGCLKSG